MDTQQMTIRLPEDVYEQLRREAFDTRESMNTIITEVVRAHEAARANLTAGEPAREPTPGEWRLAFEALADLIQDEYPGTLAHIVDTWGSASPEYVEAVRIAAEFTEHTNG